MAGRSLAPTASAAVDAIEFAMMMIVNANNITARGGDHDDDEASFMF